MLLAGALALLLIGLVMSAFFSGAETGFYRATRIRLVLDARSGDRIAQGLWWIVNRPTMFVATTLVGNNVANYLTSLGAVMATHLVYTGHGRWAELITPIVLAPVVFVYGELLPKNLFFDAPYRLLRRSGPLLLIATVVFIIPSSLLWALSRLLERISGSSPQDVKLALARKELQQVMEEGRQAGVLQPVQEAIVQGLLAVADQPVGTFAAPLGRVVRVRLGTPKAEILRLARRHHLACVPVEEPLGRRRVIGYVRVVDLYLNPIDEPPQVRDLVAVPYHQRHITALIKLRQLGEPLARVVDERGETLGIVTAAQLAVPLLRVAV